MGQVFLELFDDILTLLNEQLVFLFGLLDGGVHVLEFLVLVFKLVVLLLGLLESKLDLYSFIDRLLKCEVKVF